MKKKLIIFLLIFDVAAITVCFYINKKYLESNNILNNELDGISYENKIEELNNKYNTLISDISDMVGYEINIDYKMEDVIIKLNDEYDDLTSSNEKLIKNKELLLEQKITLTNNYNKIIEEQIRHSTFIISNVPNINQYSLGYPTGCESAALTVLLKYHGVGVSIGDVVNILPKGNLPYYENGELYGGNPNVEFIGNPNNYSSYGVYEKPIIQVAKYFKNGVSDGTGMSLNDVLKVVSEGRPVIVWVIMNMSVPYVSTSWIYKPTGERIDWLSGEHALVIIGYNQNQIIVSDSLTGSVRYYDKGVFENRYNTYGRKAVYY